MSAVPAAVDELFARARGGHRGSLARLITHLERDGPAADAVDEVVRREPAHAHVVGLTGAPGCGKSTLTGRLLECLVAAGRRPAVLAVDPSSPLTGGAILGDRVRMNGRAKGAFVRSMATRGHQGGLAAAVPAALRLLACLRFDPLIVETTGVGQVEVDIASTADTTVLVVAPGWGDAVQANKAGLLEVADVLVVNKADRRGASDARRDLELMLDLGHISGLEERIGGRPEIVMATSTAGAGVPEVLRAIDDHARRTASDGSLDERRRRRRRMEVSARAQRILLAHLSEVLEPDRGHRALAAVEEGDAPTADAVRAALAEVGRRLPSR